MKHETHYACFEKLALGNKSCCGCFGHICQRDKLIAEMFEKIGTNVHYATDQTSKSIETGECPMLNPNWFEERVEAVNEQLAHEGFAVIDDLLLEARCRERGEVLGEVEKIMHEMRQGTFLRYEDQMKEVRNWIDQRVEDRKYILFRLNELKSKL